MEKVFGKNSNEMLAPNFNPQIFQLSVSSSFPE
jgi:hypothetical protein